MTVGKDSAAINQPPDLTGMNSEIIIQKVHIEAAYANSSPNNHFARIAKVGKEEIMGLLVARELAFEDEEKQRQEWTAMLNRVADRLKKVPGVRRVHSEPGR